MRISGRLGPGVFPPLFFLLCFLFAMCDRKNGSGDSLCSELDHLLAGTVSHGDQRLHVELLLTQDQEALLP